VGDVGHYAKFGGGYLNIFESLRGILEKSPIYYHKGVLLYGRIR
jgi:hypothetical protein